MARLTNSNAKGYLYSSVRKYVELTGEQVALIFTEKGNISVIGRESFKNFVSDHRREILRTMVKSSTTSDPFTSPTLPTEIDESTTVLDPSTYSCDRLRQLVAGAVKSSLGGSRVFSKKRRPLWWNPKIPFANLKSGYSKDTLVGLLTDYKTSRAEGSIALDFQTTDIAPASPIRQRSPNLSAKSVDVLTQQLESTSSRSTRDSLIVKV